MSTPSLYYTTSVVTDGVPLVIPILVAQPTTVVCKMEAQSEHAHIAHTFLHVSRRLVC